MKATTKLRKENTSLKEENRKLVKQNESFEVSQDVMKIIIDDKSKQVEELQKDKEECNKLKTKLISEYFLNTELERKRKTSETSLLTVGIQVIPDLIKFMLNENKPSTTTPAARPAVNFCESNRI